MSEDKIILPTSTDEQKKTAMQEREGMTNQEIWDMLNKKVRPKWKDTPYPAEQDKQ